MRNDQKQQQKYLTMNLAPIDAIWPPIVLILMAIITGFIAGYFGIISLCVLAVIGVAILIGDCFGRSKDYRNARCRFYQARDEFETSEVIRRFRRAWCARVACRAAWKREYSDHDLQKLYVAEAYYKMGYRWWHFFPDGTFTKNSPFLKIAFWVHLFTGKMKRDSVEVAKPVIEPAE